MGKRVKRYKFRAKTPQFLLEKCEQIASEFEMSTEECIEALNSQSLFKGIKEYIEEGIALENEASSIQGERDYQEDAFLTYDGKTQSGDRIRVLAVFDGHGGSKVSSFLRENFLSYFPRFTMKGKFYSKKEIEKIYHKIDKDIFSQLGEEANEMGSTASAVFYNFSKPDKIQVVQLGDSFAWVGLCDSSEEKAKIWKCEEHSPENEAERIEKLASRGVDEDSGGVSEEPFPNLRIVSDSGTSRIAHNNSRISFSVSRAFGDFDFKRSHAISIEGISTFGSVGSTSIEIDAMPVTPQVEILDLSKLRTTLLTTSSKVCIFLGSDGVTESLAPEEIFSETSSQELVNRALTSGSTDNITAIITHV